MKINIVTAINFHQGFHFLRNSAIPQIRKFADCGVRKIPQTAKNDYCEEPNLYQNAKCISHTKALFSMTFF
jgi:hypothetical protein